MTIKTTAIAITTAAAISLGALGTTANAAPLGAGFTSAPSIEAGVELTKKKGKKWKKKNWHRRNDAMFAIGAAAVLGSALAIGAASAANARECYVERVRVWRPKLGAYVIRKQRVCY